jgi:two-component system response regulator PilR (NtrC family)
MTQSVALIIDDEPDIRELLDITLQRMDIDTRSASSIGEAMALLEKDTFDLCLADMRLPDGDGIDIVRHMATSHPGTPVAMITAHGNMDTAIEALKAGAFDFVSKPVDLLVLRKLVETALRLRRDGEAAKAGTTTPGEADLLGKSAAMEGIRGMIGKLARSQAPVFVSGESGTGKELASRLIHRSGPRQDSPFVAVNCGAIPGELMESELFGHVKGSFTGAVRDKQGLFQAADGGTLFLDEVADLPLSMQVKLLRAIQEKRIRPVGAAEEIEVDVRLISASHKNINRMVANGEFRQDLFYRIHVIELNMPPLRERREDIPVMIDHILGRISRDSGAAKPRIDRAALQALYQHAYPGNVRELENILERACALCEDGVVQLGDLGLDSVYHQAEKSPMSAEGDLEGYLADVERKVIEQALAATHWNRTAAAKKLGLTLRSLRYRMEKLGLEQAPSDQGSQD